MAETPSLHDRIARLFSGKLNVDPPETDADLFEAGVLDSLAFVELLLHVEREFGVTVAVDDLQVENFRSIDRIAAFVTARAPITSTTSQQAPAVELNASTPGAPVASKEVAMKHHSAALWAMSTVLAFALMTPPHAVAQLPGSAVVTMTSPTSGSSVSGTISVVADVSLAGSIVITQVQFKLDGANLGAMDTTGPYSVPWNTTTASNGSHILTAVARDTLGLEYVSNPVTVTVDNIAPTVTVNQKAGQSDPTNLSPINFTVIFSETVSGFTAADVTIAGTAGGTNTVAVTGGPTTYNVAVSGMTDGTVIATIAVGIAQDAAGNGNTASTSTDNTVAFDTAVPTVTINQTASQVDPANTSPINFMAIFSEPASDFTAADVTITGTAGGTKTVTMTGGPITYNVAVSGMTDGTVITAVAAGVARDAAGNFNAASTSTDNQIAFDATAPAVAVTSPASGATVSGQVAVAASASDNAGVTGVQFRLDGVNLGAEDTTTPFGVTWDTTTVADGPHTLTAEARDAAGNRTTSAPVTVTVSNPLMSTTTRIENADRSITYTDGTTAPGRPAGWWHGSRSRSWSNDTSSFNRSAGARATFRFTGTAVRWIGFRAFWAGIARVSIDGGPFTQTDLFLPPCTPEQKAQGCKDEEPQVAIFTAQGLAAGIEHTLIIEATGTKHGGDACSPLPGPDCSQDYAVVVDAIDVAPASVPSITGTRFEDTDATVSYTGTWQADADPAKAWSGGIASVSGTAGHQATFTFTGTSVAWVGLRGPQAGIARVFLDGAFHAEVDTFSPVEIRGGVFTALNLAVGSHTLRIDVTGLKNASATGTSIFVDAFDVRSRSEDLDPSIIYTGPGGSWVLESPDKAWSGTSANTGTGTASRSATAGARAEFTFTGTPVSWIGFRGPSAGIADVYLDAVFLTQVDLYASTEALQVPVFTLGNLISGQHTLRIDVTGQKNPSSTGTLVVVDAFDVTLSAPQPPVSRFQEAAPSVTFTSGWTQGTKFELWTGELARYSDTAGAQATFTFTGTSIRWIGERRRTGGIARVYLDGAFVSDVDTFASMQDEFQAVNFTSTGLAPGQHTISIEVTGLKRGGPACSPSPAPDCSAGYDVVVDAFDVQ